MKGHLQWVFDHKEIVFYSIILNIGKSNMRIYINLFNFFQRLDFLSYRYFFVSLFGKFL